MQFLSQLLRMRISFCSVFVILFGGLWLWVNDFFRCKKIFSSASIGRENQQQTSKIINAIHFMKHDIIFIPWPGKDTLQFTSHANALMTTAFFSLYFVFRMQQNILMLNYRTFNYNWRNKYNIDILNSSLFLNFNEE